MAHVLGRMPSEPTCAPWPIDCEELDVVANACPMGLSELAFAGEAAGGCGRPAGAFHASEAVVFIDSGVSDVSAIVKAASANAELVMLDPESDGLVQIARHLAERPQTKSISLLAPGCSDGLQLGNVALSREDLAPRHGPALAAIRQALSGRVELRCAGGPAGAPCQDCVLALVAEAIGAELVAP